jgi:hypothetical protein
MVINNGNSARDAQFCSSGRQLSAMVRLRTRSSDKHVRSGVNALPDRELQLSGFVASKRETGAVIPLDENAGTGHYLSQPGTELQWCWKMSQRDAWETRNLGAEFID